VKVAFLGLGIMGSRQAANLVRAGFELSVWNRTASVAEAFASEHPSASVASDPREAAAGSSVVCTMVVDGPAVERLLLGEQGAAHAAQPGTLFLDMSTTGVEAAVRIGAGLRELGMRFMDAPVTGSSPRAQDGTLTFMVGGEAEDLEEARPLLQAMGELIVHAGAVGHGQLVKVINNAVAAVNATTLGQALLVARRAGADLDALLEVMGAGSGGSVMLELKSEPMRRHDFTPLFKLDHMLKDVRLCLEASEAAGIPFPFAALSAEVLAESSELGFGEADFAALIAALERSAGTTL
jgi:3-hydroxyisobutyrate dehydrogenase-like beta-hydroxyacid dehydrogenase